ncbi:MAG: HpcH/HpaI aldolase/citrate lyase family protein [Oceanisphaera sp.]|uniref:HpcH/HpaI aldolase/citrate lyase family protein n=1 Tax=Oceanisphaera sp. TaxID=1929979 RepID=UPI003F9D2B48
MDINALQTLLFVPATRPERFDKALASGADAIIIDLEDAVPAAEKEAAGKALSTWLDTQPSNSVLIRINPINSPWFKQDTQLCRSNAVAGIVVPKVEDANALAELASACEKPLLPFIESALALHRLNDIAAVSGVARFLFGKLDLALDLGMDYPQPAGEPLDESAFLYARSQLVVCSRVHGLAAPIDAIFTALYDAKGLTDYARQGMRLGFSGFLLIHPAQVKPAQKALTPTSAQISWAKHIIEAEAREKGGVVAVGGNMVDLPIVSRAKRIMELVPNLGK